jgi:hypothetical protein
MTLGIWALATILAITLPVMVTGTDPTRIPFAALFAPPAAAMLTALAGVIASVFRGGPGGGVVRPRSWHRPMGLGFRGGTV